MDLCSLISNLLDNAIEANCKLDITKRRLQIEIKPYNNMLLLFISNSSMVYTFMEEMATF